MKFFTFALFLFSTFIFSQNTRFVYQVSMKTDSTDRNSVKTENAYLDVSAAGSQFYGEMRAKRDSVLSRMRNTGSFDRSQMQNLRSAINYTVLKDYGKNTVVFQNRIARDLYSYEEDRPLEWKILPETAKIGTYTTQKAETEFAGRKWTAWFTQEIPVTDGPYKFKGLPGLIVKVEDAKGDYSFDLMKATKITTPLPLTQGNVIKVKRKDFEKQEALFREDPASVFTTSVRGGGARGEGRSAGWTPNPAQRKAMEERVKAELLKYNNPLELKN